jgi:hypothetical protein
MNARAPVSAADINKLLDSTDPDLCLGYLTLVNGIDGAILCSRDGWVVAAGENTLENVLIEAPYFLSQFQESLDRLDTLGLDRLDSQIAFNEQKFYLILNLERSNRFFLVVSGARGSYDLFKYRVERVAHALADLLRSRGFFRS